MQELPRQMTGFPGQDLMRQKIQGNLEATIFYALTHYKHLRTIELGMDALEFLSRDPRDPTTIIQSLQRGCDFLRGSHSYDFRETLKVLNGGPLV